MAYFTVDRRDTIALVTFDRPPRNLMSMAAMTELEATLGALADDDSVNVVVITGGVPGYFVAHADLEDLMRLGRGEPVEGDPGSWGRTFSLIGAMPQPVVAAINGQAWGGGCELSLACTLRVASASAHLGQPEVVVGIIPGGGGTQRLPRLIGPGRAAELILTGRIVDATEAERIGLVDAVLPDEGFVEAAVAWAARIAERPRHAVVAAKRAMVEGLELPLDEGLRVEGRLFIECQTAGATLAVQQAAVDRYRQGDGEQIEPTDLD
jgi:enoyl-CoA hydratase/carnithine racemase